MATRSYREAVEAGNFFEIQSLATRKSFGSWGCDTIAETIFWAVKHGVIVAGERCEITRHLPGSRIGAVYAEVVGYCAAVPCAGITLNDLAEA